MTRREFNYIKTGFEDLLWDISIVSRKEERESGLNEDYLNNLHHELNKLYKDFKKANLDVEDFK